MGNNGKTDKIKEKYGPKKGKETIDASLGRQICAKCQDVKNRALNLCNTDKEKN